jgi:hypothetical protein
MLMLQIKDAAKWCEQSQVLYKVRIENCLYNIWISEALIHFFSMFLVCVWNCEMFVCCAGRSKKKWITKDTVHIHIGTLFAKSAETVPSLYLHRPLSAQNKPAMDNKPVKIYCNKERRYDTWKRCIPRNTRMFYLCADLSCARFSCIASYKKSTCLTSPITSTYLSGWNEPVAWLYMHHTYLLCSFTYHLRTNGSTLSKNKCKIHKNTLLSVLQRHGLPLFIWIFVSQVPSHF